MVCDSSNHVLGLEETSGFDSLGWPRWQLVLCLALAYIVLFLALFKGVKSSGKVVWVTAIAPYIILLILLIRGIFLPGAVDGLRFYLNFDLKRLGHTQVINQPNDDYLSFSDFVEVMFQTFYFYRTN